MFWVLIRSASLLMSTHNICFSGEIEKYKCFLVEKSALSGAVKFAKEIRLQGYLTFFMLNSAEHEIFSANKYENASNNWHFHIY